MIAFKEKTNVNLCINVFGYYMNYIDLPSFLSSKEIKCRLKYKTVTVYYVFRDSKLVFRQSKPTSNLIKSTFNKMLCMYDDLYASVIQIHVHVYIESIIREIYTPVKMHFKTQNNCIKGT